MAIGEEQIVAQIKATARAAATAGTTGPAIIGLIDAALRASKRARTQTTIGTEGISLAQAGLGIAAAHLGGLADRHAVVLGTGKVLHRPTVRAKEFSTGPKGPVYLDALTQLFELTTNESRP